MASCRAVLRYTPLVIGLLYFISIATTTFTVVFESLLRHAPVTGVVLSTVTLGALVLGVTTLLRCVFVDAGAPPPWLRADRIDAFVRSELQRIVDEHRRPAHAHDDDDDAAAAAKQEGDAQRSPRGAPHDAAQHASANATLYTLLSQRMRDASAEDSVEVPVLAMPQTMSANATAATATMTTAATREQREHDSRRDDATAAADDATAASTVVVATADDNNDNDNNDTTAPAAAVRHARNNNNNSTSHTTTTTTTDKLPLDVPDNMDRRRQRKQRYGLPVLTVGQLARAALQALDADAETREHEMAFLLRGARVCRHCGVYNLLDTVHCSKCERCVQQRDHHNYLIGQCIGVHTHKYYLLAMVYVSVALLVSCLVMVVTVYKHWAIIYDSGHEEEKTWFVLCAILIVTLLLLVVLLLSSHVLAIGKAESSDAADRRAEREWQEQFALRLTTSGMYRPLNDDEDTANAAPPQPFNRRNLQRVFGDGAPGLRWLLPTPPLRATAAAREQAFWAALRAQIDMQLHSAADLPSDAEHGDAAFLERCNMPAPAITAAAAAAAQQRQQSPSTAMTGNTTTTPAVPPLPPRDGDDDGGGVALDVAGPLTRLSPR